jgi:hypothetical protein
MNEHGDLRPFAGLSVCLRLCTRDTTAISVCASAFHIVILDEGDLFVFCDCIYLVYDDGMYQ